MATQQDAINRARQTGRGVLLLPDGRLAEQIREHGAHTGWLTDDGELLPVDTERLLAAMPSGLVLHADGRLDRRQRVKHISTRSARPFLP